MTDAERVQKIITSNTTNVERQQKDEKNNSRAVKADRRPARIFREAEAAASRVCFKRTCDEKKIIKGDFPNKEKGKERRAHEGCLGSRRR